MSHFTEAPQVLYEDNHLLILNKPANMPVQQDESNDLDLLRWGKQYIKEKYQKPGDVFLGLLHRLDRPVSGVVAFARTSKAAQRLTKDLQQNLWQKSYLGIVCGDAPNQCICEDYLFKDPLTHSSKIVPENTPQAKFAKLSFETLNRLQQLSLLSITLETGRHHQIRVQLASRSLPLWGDARYNQSSKPGQQIALQACSLSLLHPISKERLCFLAKTESAFPWAVFESTLQRYRASFASRIEESN